MRPNGPRAVDPLVDPLCELLTLEVELKGSAPGGFIPAVEQTVKEVMNFSGSVRILDPGTLPPDHKTIEDVRKWD